MCQRRTPNDPDDIHSQYDAFAACEGLKFHVELQFGPVGKDQYPKLVKELERQLQEILQDGRLTVRIDNEYYEPLRVSVVPVQ